MLGNQYTIVDTDWPIWDRSLVSSESVRLVIQFNGKRRGEIEIEKDLNKESIIKIIREKNSFNKYFIDKTIIKEIYVDNRLINFVVK